MRDLNNQTAPKFTVVIVNFNAGPYLQNALDSLAKQTFRRFEVVLVDNASSDGSMQSLDLRGLPAISIIQNSENLGFAKANNQAAGRASGEWLALLNPDSCASPEWLEALDRVTSEYPSCRTFASTQLALHAPHLIDGAGDAYLLFGFPWRGGFGRPVDELPSRGYCFSACGASAVYQTELFRQLHGFDERFFCYCEDVDLGFRLQLAGEDCRLVPDAVIYHAGSAISGLHSAFSTYHGTRNRIWTYAKNMPLVLLMATMPMHIALSLYVLATSAFTPRFPAILRGLRDGLLGAPRLRSSEKWKAPRNRRAVRRLLQTTTLNPWKMHQRRVHVRTDYPPSEPVQSVA